MGSARRKISAWPIPLAALGVAVALATGCTALVDLDGLTNDGTAWTPTQDASLKSAEAGDPSVSSALTPEAGSPPAADAGHAGDASSTAHDAGDSGAPTTCVAAGGNACAHLPLFHGPQKVDGVDDEFCDIAPTVFHVAQGMNPDPSTADAGVAGDATAYLRVAWSSVGLHVHVHVDKSPVSPPATQDVWNGDAIELFMTPSSTATGSYGPGADDGVQVLVAPLSASQAPNSAVNTVAAGLSGPLDASEYAARLVQGGYEIELQLSWQRIAGHAITAPASGSSIRFDLAVDIGVSGSRVLQTSLWWADPGTSPSCGGPTYAWCDDRTWCTPSLQP